MKSKLKSIILGFLACLTFVLLLSNTRFASGAGVTSSIATSSDGKYVYIIGAQSDHFYKSEDFGETFDNIPLD